MCDLIDLNSPDVRGLLDSTKLASPLIPAPKNVESNDETNSLMTEKRGNERNNPFDRVLHETAEYVSKKGDPFEVMLQRALKSKNGRCTNPIAQSVNFTDDFTPKRKRRYLKMNKTLDVLDGSLLENKLNLFNGDKTIEIKKEIPIHLDTRNANICDNNTPENMLLESASKQKYKIFVVDPDPLELSILNQSAMNDTLLEAVVKSKDSNMSLLEKDTLFKEFLLPSNVSLRPLDYQRSLSQGVEKSPKKLLCLNKRSQSVTDNQKKVSQSDCSELSPFLDRAFLESKQSDQSVFSTLSSISSITKLTSISSSVLSNDTMNHAFLDSGLLKTSHEKINTTENSLEIKPRLYDLSDLTEKLNKLKCTMNGTNISSVTENESNSMREENDKQITNDKLIDVDVFVPEQDSSKEFNKSSISTSSSDSVFNHAGKVDRSILSEAKMLAKTFEELTLKTDSGSSIDDDLISSNTLWMSELLPAFEDEPTVDNLIELPVSSEENSKNLTNNNKKQSPTNIDNAEENFLKEMEMQFTNCIPVAKQTVVTSLLSDLRKLVNVENNPEVNKLLDNLENALDINYESNIELLEKCLNISNDLRNPQKVSSDIVESIEKTSTDKSEEESRKEKSCNSEKSLADINHKLENTSQVTVSSDDSSIKSLSCKDSNENELNIINSSKDTHTDCAMEKDNQPDEKLAIELLVNLGKLLNGQAEDDTTMQILKNIGKALNVASNNYNIEHEVQTDCNRLRRVQQTTPVKAAESDYYTHSSAFSTERSHRRSFEPKSKLLEKTTRRSISVIDSSPKSTSGTQTHKRRDTSESGDCKKRFSSDPGYISNVTNKKIATSEVNNMSKAKIAENKKERSIAVSDVKNKLKKRSDVISKRGPMKAVHPVDNMQKKRAALGKQIPSSKTTTPPKSDKTTPSDNRIISSTPNSMDNNYYVPKKPAKSKPMASSTPDGQNSKALSAQLMSANKKRNLSCDISPVTTYVNMNSSDERKDDPKRTSKLPTSKKCTTPKRQQADACGIPRYSTPPRHNSSLNANRQQSPQRLNKSLMNCHRYSPVSQKKSAEKIQQSPLKETNRITAKVKPLNLISRIKRHSTDFTEKENNYI